MDGKNPNIDKAQIYWMKNNTLPNCSSTKLYIYQIVQEYC